LREIAFTQARQNNALSKVTISRRYKENALGDVSGPGRGNIKRWVKYLDPEEVTQTLGEISGRIRDNTKRWVKYLDPEDITQSVG
jgi:hypothetical protein